MPTTENKHLLILRAIDFAARKHRDQRRKDQEASPYINHPISVSLMLAEIGGIADAEVLAAAILHDTLEDTDTTPEELVQAFGMRVRKLVEEVTDDNTQPPCMPCGPCRFCSTPEPSFPAASRSTM